MTSAVPIRPVLTSLIALAAAACGEVEGEGRFASMADRVAAVPVSGSPGPAPAADGLRRPDLRVEVMTPHQLWDARDGLAIPPEPVPTPAATEEGPPAALPVSATTPDSPAATVQLGAYASEAAARAAWARLAEGPARAALAGLAPRFETAEVAGRRLVRLKVAAPEAEAAAVCEAARIDDPLVPPTGLIPAPVHSCRLSFR